MPETERYAERAARLLRQRAPGPDSRTSRDVGVSVVAQAIAARRRRRTTRLGAAAALFAAAAGVTLLLTHARPSAAPKVAACSGPGCSAATVPAPHAGAHAFARGERLAAPADRAATVLLETGTRISVDRQGAIECREDGATQRFGIVRGRAELHVAKLHPGERFLVDTPDAEIEVHGTSFSVRLAEASPECAARTSVDVEEGVVEVRFDGRRAFLHAGDQWTHDCVPSSTAATTRPRGDRAAEHTPARAGTRSLETAPVAPAAPVPANSSAASADASPRADAAASATPVSALTEQNELYARAQAAAREGRSGEALAAYARLLQLFPNGPLVESASVQRVRLLVRLDRAQARAEADRYLVKFPNGFARHDMEALTFEP